MIKGLYTAASGMLTTQRNLDIVSNNLANSNTRGFKRDEGINESFPEMVMSRIENGRKSATLGSLGTGVHINESYTDFNQADLNHTGNELNLAIKGDGFFVIQTPAGRRYTRNGNFTLNQQGQVVTQQGYSVLGERGNPLQTINGRNIKFDSDGQLYLGNLQGDQIQVVEIADKKQLTKVGENLYKLNNNANNQEQPAQDYQVLQGYLEGSNVNVVQEMSKMIETTRLYEANQKVIQSIDSTLDKTVNQVGRVG